MQTNHDSYNWSASAGSKTAAIKTREAESRKAKRAYADAVNFEAASAAPGRVDPAHYRLIGLGYAVAILCAASLVFMPDLTVRNFLSSQQAALIFWGSVAALVLTSVLAGRHVHRRMRAIEQAHLSMRHNQSVDHVSGAFTRSHFIALLAEAVDRAGKDDSAVALVIIDIDHFKQINDVLGPSGGDAALAFCARTAQEIFSGQIVGRLGGDELAVLLVGSPARCDATLGTACDRYLSTLQDGFWFQNCRQPVSVSLGVARAPEHTSDVKELMTFADMALAQIKSAGRGSWGLFTPSILADMRQERFLERELRAALLLKELEVHYQPIVNASGQLNSVEALVRWASPIRGTIPPVEFIPVAEKSQLIHDLGRYVLERVCEDMATLPAVSVNVNVSPRQLNKESFLDDYLAIVRRHGVATDRIILEITESAKLATSKSFIERLVAVRAAGFRIALDDFGMGYSEFNQLRQLPFDIIKIDKSYIQSIGTDVVTDTFVSAVTQIAGQMERLVVAEGIETHDDNVRASVAGCGLFQGYYYQRPIALDGLIERYTRDGKVRTSKASTAA